MSPQTGLHETSEVYPETAVVTSTVYNNKVIFASRDFPMYSYDGFKFEQIEAASDPRPAYVVCATTFSNRWTAWTTNDY